ncbi:MAG: ABC transporter ATP-binding protein [Verrucomicrobiota bacterium]
MKEIRRFLGYLKGYEGQIALSAVLILSVSALMLPYPLIMKEMLDGALPRRDTRLLAALMALFGLVFLARGALQYLNRFLLQRVGMRITCDLRKDVFKHLQTLSLKYYDSRRTGQIVARVAEDTGALFTLVTGVLISLISDSVTVLAVLGMLFWINGKLALLTLAVLPFFVLNYRVFRKKLRRLSRRHRRNWDRVVGFLHERVASARLIKSFSTEERESERFGRGIENDYRNFNQLTLHNALLWVIADLISSVGVLIVLFCGGWFVIRGRMTVGQLVAFNTYIGFLYGPIVRLNDLNATVERAITGLEKIYEILDTPSFAVEKPDARDLPPIQGRVEFRNVHFSYEAGRRVVANINLVAEPGQMVALVGPSGSGKTTLVNLLCRFYDVDQGAILIDGIDIREVRVKSLRRQIGVVMQESILFSGTLADNIRYGLPAASMEAAVEAAKAANAHDFIMKLPRRYNTAVGERGVRLSGGQRQRIAIARAILKDPRILVFDEATSSLDTRSERLIQEAMERLMRGRTAFVIAHRLSTILRADKIVVVQGGAIVEEGSHSELLARDGLYRRLYELQFQPAVPAGGPR